MNEDRNPKNTDNARRIGSPWGRRNAARSCLIWGIPRMGCKVSVYDWVLQQWDCYYGKCELLPRKISSRNYFLP